MKHKMVPIKIIHAIDYLKDKTLYKFRSIPKDSSDPTKPDHKKIHYIERIFTHNELYFPSPIDLNDPLECRPLFLVGDLSDPLYKKNYVNYVTRRIKVRSNQHPNQIRTWVENLTQQMANNLARKQQNDYRRQLQKYRICSFCSEPDNPIVWSHYADQHRGFSLIFRADNDLFGSAIKIEYQDEYPRLDVIEDDAYAILRNSALVKFSDWSYEKEFRLISSEPAFEGALPVKNKKWNFPAEMLIGIIFGCKIIDSDRRLLENLCKNYSSKLQKKRVVPNDDKFLLKIIDI
ncbi:MAG: DUF2971 domain-containing protein [Desulfobaccales bacterium]